MSHTRRGFCAIREPSPSRDFSSLVCCMTFGPASHSTLAFARAISAPFFPLLLFLLHLRHHNPAASIDSLCVDFPPLLSVPFQRGLTSLPRHQRRSPRGRAKGHRSQQQRGDLRANNPAKFGDSPPEFSRQNAERARDPLKGCLCSRRWARATSSPRTSSRPGDRPKIAAHSANFP